MTLKRPWFFATLGVCTGVVACGGRGPGMMPTNDPPSITCPAAPDPVDSLDGSAQAVSYPAPTVTAGQPPVTTACLPVSGSAFPVGTTTVNCTANDAKARTATCSFPVIVEPPPKLPVTSFLAFGDSITWGQDGRDTANALPSGQHVYVQLVGQTYPEVLESALRARYRQQQVSVTNAGCPGESLTDPGRFEDKQNCRGIRADDPSAYRRFTSLVSVRQWDAVLLMEGSNDANTAAGDSKVLDPAVNMYLRGMIDAAKGAGMKVIVATIPPMVPPGFKDRAKGYLVVPTFNDMVKALVTSEGVPLSDVYAGFGSEAPALIGFDGLHPNAAGYQRIADTFFATIKSSLETKTSGAARVSRRR